MNNANYVSLNMNKIIKCLFIKNSLMLFIKFLFFSLYFHIAFVILNVNKEEKDEGENKRYNIISSRYNLSYHNIHSSAYRN